MGPERWHNHQLWPSQPPTIPEWSSKSKKVRGPESWVEKNHTRNVSSTVHSWKLPIPHELSRFCFFEKSSRARASPKRYAIHRLRFQACLVCTKKIWLLLSREVLVGHKFIKVTTQWLSISHFFGAVAQKNHPPTGPDGWETYMLRST